MEYVSVGSGVFLSFIVATSEFSFDYPQQIAYSALYQDSEEGEEDMVVVFAPLGGQGYKKYQDPSSGNWTYVRIGADAQVKERVAIKSKTGGWHLQGHTVKDDIVYLLGPAEHKKDKYRNQYIGFR